MLWLMRSACSTRILMGALWSSCEISACGGMILALLIYDISYFLTCCLLSPSIVLLEVVSIWPLISIVLGNQKAGLRKGDLEVVSYITCGSWMNPGNLQQSSLLLLLLFRF